MAKRLMSIAAIAALMLGVSAVSAGSASATTPVNAQGAMHCVLTGKIKITPPLVFGGTAGSASFVGKFKSSSCAGGSGVTAISGTLSSTLPSNDCGALGGALPAMTFGPAKLKAPTKYNPTTLSFGAGGVVTVAEPPTVDLPGAGSSSASGSFAGQTPTMHLVFDTTLATLAANCQPKTKGVKGSGGFKGVSLGAGSYVDIPA